MFSEPPPEPPEEDVWEELINELTTSQKVLKFLPAGAVSATSVTLPVMIGVFGWILAPVSMGRAGALLGAAGASGGFKAGQKLKELRRGVVPAVIAELIREDGVRKLDPEEIAKLGKQYGVGAEQFEAQLTQVYQLFLQELLQEDAPQISEVSDLGALRRGLGLDWNATQSAHAAKAAEMLGDEPPPSAAATPPVLRKLLWLSVALFATGKGQADYAAVADALGLSTAEAEQLVNQVSTPLYKAAIAKAVGKYNATETPMVLQKVRGALCLTNDATEEVHNMMYDAQLALMLPSDDPDSKLTEEKMRLLGELEGILQVRSAGMRLQGRALPIFRAAVERELEAALEEEEEEEAATGGMAWARLATRQLELRLEGDIVEAATIEAARGVAAAELEAAALQHDAGDTGAAQQTVARLLRFGSFVSEMLEAAGLGGGVTGDAVAQRYLGALCLDTEELEASAQRLAEEGLREGSGATALQEGADLLRAMLALSAPQLESAKQAYASLLERFVATGSFDEEASSTRSWQDKLQREGGSLPVALRQKLALDAYYSWLSDLAEQMDRGALESAASLRECLQLDGFSVAELYSRTAVDQLALKRCCEQLVEQRKPLPAKSQQAMRFLERELGAAPGTAELVMRAMGGMG